MTFIRRRYVHLSGITPPLASTFARRMSVIVILLAASLSIAICFLFAFIWSVKNGQYDDDYTPSVRMLFDDKTDIHAESRARDAKGLALFCEGNSGTKKAEAIAEPKAARTGAQKSKKHATKTPGIVLDSSRTDIRTNTPSTRTENN